MLADRRTLLLTTVVAIVLAAAAGCAFGPPDGGGGGRPPTLTPPTNVQEPPGVVATVIAEGLDVPWGIAFLPDGAALVTERDNRRIMRVAPEEAGTELLVTPVQTIDEARPSGEGGLLGIAVSPDYTTYGLIFIYYKAQSDNRIARLRLGGTPEPIVTGIPRAEIHNGGRLAFGPDGYLYASTGDGGDSSRSQDPASLAGKILRMTMDGSPAPGNPFPGSLIWSYGHRNVQGLAWDAQGRMFATEFGQSTWDEINRIEPGSNYGWPEVEGIAGVSSYVDPIQQWPTSQSSCSGAAIAGDVLLAACLRGERAWLLSLDAEGDLAGPPVATLVGEYGRLRAATAAPDGSIWVSTSNRDGRGHAEDGDDRILRLVVTGGGGIALM